MKQRNVAITLALIISATWTWLAIYQPPISAQPQELPKGKKAAVTPPAEQRPPEAVATANDRQYPIFFIDDVLSRLKSSVDELVEQKVAKNSQTLKLDLKRTECAVALGKPSPREITTQQELYRKASESVFLVAGLTKPEDKDGDWQTAFSTAFAIHEDGILSTSAHVFDHDDQDTAVVVLDVKGNVYPVLEILAADLKADTCLFRIGCKGLKPLPLTRDALPGSPIRVMGHPGDSFYFFSAGIIANYERDHDGLVWMNVTADFGQGSSGGPVMDTAGNVVGQVSRTYTLYAGGEATNRRRRQRATRQVDAAEVPGDQMAPADADEPDPRRRSDTQMIFKACTPVSAIRALIK